MSTICRQTISSLRADAQNTLVIGIIINSLNARTFEGKSRYNNTERAVWTFTLRDSEKDFINVTVWGSPKFVMKLYNDYQLTTVVEVINAKVVERRMGDKNESFVPSVPCPYTLVVNEGTALVQIHDNPTPSTTLQLYERLFTLAPTENNLQPLRTVLEEIEELQEQYVDLLLVVTFISDARNVITRGGKTLKCRNFEAGDGSTEEVVPLTLWECGWVERARNWIPKETVVFLKNARIAFDDYRKKIAVTIARKTLITENPENIPQAAEIRAALRYYNPDAMPTDPFSIPNPEAIRVTMTIEEITGKLNEKTKAERLQIATILRASVTDMNVDSTSSKLIFKRCTLCKRIVTDDRDSCMNLNCPYGNGMRVPRNMLDFNIRVNLKDDTGYLVGCRLTGDTAAFVLDCTPDEFQVMTLQEREDLKWKYLLEECEIRLHILGPTSAFPRASYNILSLKRLRDVEDQEEEEGQQDNVRNQEKRGQTNREVRFELEEQREE